MASQVLSVERDEFVFLFTVSSEIWFSKEAVVLLQRMLVSECACAEGSLNFENLIRSRERHVVPFPRYTRQEGARYRSNLNKLWESG